MLNFTRGVIQLDKFEYKWHAHMIGLKPTPWTDSSTAFSGALEAQNLKSQLQAIAPSSVGLARAARWLAGPCTMKVHYQRCRRASTGRRRTWPVAHSRWVSEMRARDLEAFSTMGATTPSLSNSSNTCACPPQHTAHLAAGTPCRLLRLRAQRLKHQRALQQPLPLGEGSTSCRVCRVSRGTHGPCLPLCNPLQQTLMPSVRLLSGRRGVNLSSDGQGRKKCAAWGGKAA